MWADPTDCRVQAEQGRVSRLRVGLPGGVSRLLALIVGMPELRVCMSMCRGGFEEL